MTFSGFIVQLLNGLASASSLFLVSAGLSLIFGVTRIVNFAHGSFYMLGTYIAYTLVERLVPGLGAGPGFWLALPLAALTVGLVGAGVEILLLRRIYRAPELFQLLATFALVLVIKDAALWLWGPEELLGPRAPGLAGSVSILGRQFPAYDLFLIIVGPVVLGLLWLLLTRTRWGTLVRAATQDREMVGALGVNQAWLFTAVFALGAALAGLGGALQLPREPANLEMDLHTIGAAFVVVVVGGMGSITGAFIAALMIAEIKAICIWLGLVNIGGFEISFSKLTLVVEFLVMAVVLVLRPWGLLGRQQAPSRHQGSIESPLRPAEPITRIATGVVIIALLLLPIIVQGGSYTTVLAIDLLIAALFATSLHFIMGPAGMHSFGHAAYFGLGAYGAALLIRALGLSMEVSLLAGPLVAVAGAVIVGWFSVRLAGVYLAMLTLAFAQIAWAIVYQWDSFTGGSNGLTGIWPSALLADKTRYYYLTLVLTLGSLYLIRRMLYAPFGYAMRAGRDSPLRADAIGIDIKAVQWLAFVIAGLFAGLAGALFAFSKGSISPEALYVSRSVDGLVMVMLGGLQTLVGPAIGAVTFSWLHDVVARNTESWRAILGGIILILVLMFPQGLAGFMRQLFERRKEATTKDVALAGQNHRGRDMSLLEVNDLGKSFGGVKAVDGISFDLAAGQLLALIGPNGAGKSTTFNMINGQLRANSGSIRFAKTELIGLRPRQIWQLGVGRTFQIAETFASLTVVENVQMALLSADRQVFSFWRRAAEHKREQALALLDQVGMAGQADRACSVLAYGDVKRVELAIAMANAPKLLLMDEPTAGMAPKERNDLMALTKKLVIERGMAVLFTEHSMDVVFAYADHMIVLARGRLIAAGKPEEIRNHPKVQEVYFGTGKTFERKHKPEERENAS